MDAGITTFDTAEAYGNGHSEKVLGKAIGSRREQVQILSKVFSNHLKYDQVIGACNRSLKNLETDYLDLYQIHWPDRNVPMFGQSHFDPENERETEAIAEQLQVFSELVEAGKIRYLGLSNETPWGVSQFISVARETGAPRVISIQNAFNLLSRGFESGLSEVCYHENIGLLAYSPMAFGFLSGKYLEPGATGRVTMFPGFAQRYSKVNVSDAVSEYCKLAKDAGLTPAAMALAFVREKWFVGSTIIGATTQQQLEEDIDSGSVCLSDDLLAEIDSIHQRFPNPAP